MAGMRWALSPRRPPVAASFRSPDAATFRSPPVAATLPPSCRSTAGLLPAGHAERNSRPSQGTRAGWYTKYQFGGRFPSRPFATGPSPGDRRPIPGRYPGRASPGDRRPIPRDRPGYRPADTHLSPHSGGDLSDLPGAECTAGVLSEPRWPGPAARAGPGRGGGGAKFNGEARAVTLTYGIPNGSPRSLPPAGAQRRRWGRQAASPVRVALGQVGRAGRGLVAG